MTDYVVETQPCIGRRRYGPYAPNCTDPGANDAHPENCEGGCLYNLDSDYTEHHNLKAQQPRIYALLAARLDQQDGVGVWATEAAVAAVRDPARAGLYDDYVLQQRDPVLDVAAAAAAAAAATNEAVAPSPPHTAAAAEGGRAGGAAAAAAGGGGGGNAACTAMATKWHGFFGPYDDLLPPPSPPSPPSPSPAKRSDCTWVANRDWGGRTAPNPLGVRDATSKEVCCALCWEAGPSCAAAGM